MTVIADETRKILDLIRRERGQLTELITAATAAAAIGDY